MQAKLRSLIGLLIVLITISSAGIVGIILPHNAVVLINEIDESLVENAKITQEDLIEYTGTENYSDFTYVSNEYNNTDYTYHAVFEFYNISNRDAYIDYNTWISYNYVPGKLVFDIVFKRDIIEYNEELGYVVFAPRKQYIYNAELSTLDPNIEIINFNYMWPYYLKHFGNGTEFGFQAFVAAYLIKQDLNSLKEKYGYTDEELAYLTLNRNFASLEGVLTETVYLPHNWLYSRPAYYDLNFDMTTSYHILFNATYNGHDYSVLTGEPGSAKYFLDLVRGLYYAPNEVIVNVTQLLADIYHIDTPLELEYAKSFAAYLNYLLGKPALNWLYKHKISYLCKRTAMEWLTGVPEPFLDNKRFPLLKNDTLSGYDLDTALYYAEDTGTYNVTKVGKIFAIANIPYYEHSQSSDVIIENDFAYVVEGNRGLKIVNVSHPLFLAVGQYNDGGTTEAVALDGNEFAIVVKGTDGLEILNVTDPQEIVLMTTWNNNGKADMHDIKYVTTSTTTGQSVYLVANGEYGLAQISEYGGLISILGTFVNTTGPAMKLAVDYSVGAGLAYVAEGSYGLDVVDIYQSPMTLLYHYDSSNFTQLQNVIDVEYANSYVYVLDAVNGLLIFQSSGGNLTLVGNLPITSGEPYNNIFVDGAKVYLTQGSNGLLIVDTTNKANPQITAQYDSDAGHKGIASGVFVKDGKVYLADYTEGLVMLEYTAGQFVELKKDELRTYVECWNRPSFGQFGNWPIPDPNYANRFFDVYDSYQLYPHVEKGYRLQWNEFYMRPFVYSSLRDVALKHDLTVYVYTAEYQIPYLQLEMDSFYWMHAPDYVNMTFWHVGNWNRMLGTDLKPTDLLIAHSFPGRVSDEYHMQHMWVEPITGSIMERIDRVQYNTYAINYIETYSLLNASAIPQLELTYHTYRTWHQTYPGLTSNMASLFWFEELYTSTNTFASKLKSNFLHKIASADASRTLGAFSALALITVGFVLASVLTHKLTPKELKKKY